MIKCSYTPKDFEQRVSDQALSIYEEDLSDVETRNSLFNAISNISESMGLTGPARIEQALNIAKTIIDDFDEAQRLDDSEIRAALNEWKIKKDPENTTADHLSKDNERFNDDPFESNYGAALNAKLRAKQQANKIGVQSILYNEDGIINSISELNESIRLRQEQLLQNVINYLKTRISPENQAKYPEIFQNGRMYVGGEYTGIVERIQDLYSSILGKDNFDVRMLNKYYNDENWRILDAYNSWVILNNFDIILQSIFGKAISINPDAAKYSGYNKYSIAGGSNVYSTWRTSEEIDLSKEINNISQAIITSIPFITKNSTTPTQDNIKFNEFLYIIGKIKNIPNIAQQDWIIQFSSRSTLPENIIKKYSGKSFLDLITSIRTNAQEILPDIFQLLNNDDVITSLIGEKVIDKNTFLNIDLDIINSIYKGLFDVDSETSLYTIQERSGFQDNNYFAFICQTIDSAFKSSFLQYFRNPQGEIFERNMYDQSVNNIEYSIRDAVNSINSQAFVQDYDSIKDKYHITETTRIIPGDGEYKIFYNGSNYRFEVKNGFVIWGYNDTSRTPITNSEFLTTLANEYQKIPESISFIIDDYYKGSLKVTVSLLKNDIIFEVNGEQFAGFTSINDYKSLSNIIQDVLKQNLNIDNKYYEAYKNKFGFGREGTMTTDLMKLVSRVIVNQYISNTHLKDLSPVSIKSKLNTIFGETSPIKPIYDKQLKEIKLLTEADTKSVLDLAEAKAQATGKLTSSQVLDSEGNALASSSLSRLVQSLNYQVQQQVKLNHAAAKEFSLWNTGVFKGIQQMKEIQDNSENTSKSATEFSNAEMEYSTIFIDFFQSLFGSPKNNSPLQNGITAFIPSENSDKTYIGRMLIDLSKIKIGDESLFDILRGNITRINDFLPTIQKELGEFYNKALENINAELARVGKLINSQVGYNNWASINMLAIAANKTPLQYVNDLVTEHNNNNPQNPIILIDQVHYVADKNGNLTANLSFLENVERFKDLRKLRSFLYLQNIETVKSLIKDGLDIAVEDIPELEKRIGENWIDKRTGKVIFAKAWDDKIFDEEPIFIEDIRTSSDLELLEEHSLDIEVNPLIVAYNTLNYFFTQEFMGSTVGMFYAHPSKDTSSPLMDEKSRKAAQDKRNVSFTASMHPFLKNLLQGIPTMANIAIMPDPKDIFETISGDLFDIKPFDGATFENPFFGEWENNSLCGARVGINKKTFTHYYDEKTGTGGIIKTANFSITNDRIRGSKFYQTMIRNMTDRKWRNQDGTDFITDITHDYNDNLISFKNFSDKDGQLYFRKIINSNVHYYRINAIKNVGPNMYQRYLQEVDEQGRITGEEFIEKDGEGNYISYLVNTNYSLWNLFGGAYAMEIQPGSRKLEFTENTIKLVANIANKVGTKSNSIVRTQEDVYQPLKHSDIHLMPTIGAVKQGAGNINNLSAYGISDPSKINFMRIRMDQAGIQLDKEHNADDEDLSIMTQVLSACAARGYTQEQSQEMYNALASLARSGIKDYLDSFNEFFKAVENENASEEEKQKAADAYQKVILDTLVDALAHSTNNDSTLQMVTQELLNKAREGKQLTFQEMDTIPYSDPSVFRKLHSTIAVAMTRGAIKIKVSGVLSVLCPSYGIVKLYGDRTLSSFNDDSQIQALQTLRDNDETYELVNDPGRIQIGRTYKLKNLDGSVELRTLKTQTDYYKLKSEIFNFTSIREQFAPDIERGFEGGRELAAYNATFRGQYIKGPLEMADPSDIKAEIDSTRGWDRKVQKAKKFGLNIDLSDIEPQTIEEWIASNFPVLSRESIERETGLRSADLSKFKKIVRLEKNGGQDLIQAAHKLWEDLPENWYNQYSTQDIRNILIDIISTAEDDNDITKSIYSSRIKWALEEYEKEYDDYIQEQQNQTRTYNIYDLASVKRLSELKSQKASKEEIEQALKNVQQDLNKLHNKQGQIILDDGSIIEIDSKSVDIQPYEIVMPKIFASVFGLEVSDDLNIIKGDRDFFVKRLIERTKPQGISNSSYTIGLMRLNGSHTYILDRNQGIPQLPNFQKQTIQQFQDKNKLWRVRNGDKMYQMQKDDEVYAYQSPDGSIQEVIVTNNVNFYLQNQKYSTLNISESANIEQVTSNLSSLRKIKPIRNYLEAIQLAVEKTKNYNQAVREVQNISLENISKSPLRSYYENVGHELHTSFLKSLQVVAARIPAQSMQSFMPMKVVAFEAPDINTAYVSTTQLLFQGSDYDIDSVSLASYSFDRSGSYVMHSPFAVTDTLENLEASETIPFPTGKTLEIGEGYNFDYANIINSDPRTPFISGGLTLNTPEAIRRFGKFVELCNRLGYIPKSNSPEYDKTVNFIKDIINQHNDFINDDSAEDFAKNYVVSSMYKIGLSPANLIESQQAMDSITSPLKSVSNSTIKAQDTSLDNPGSFVTNIHGIRQNMDGKRGVGICAVGLKSFFALTARYNEVLSHGTQYEQERLKSDIIIAGKHYQMLANAYGTNISNEAIAQVISQLSNQDQALVLSGLLSLATDNAKELALSKLNAANMLGMYIYGITIGVDFKTLADIICSETGIIINEMMEGNSFSKKRGMSIQNIFDYLETAPELVPQLPQGLKLSGVGVQLISEINQQSLFDLANTSQLPLNEQLQVLNKLKDRVDKEAQEYEKRAIHRTIEEAEKYLTRVSIVNSQKEIYEDFKKLNEGGEELRKQGQLLHINQGLESSYARSINYIDTLTSVVSDRQYSIYRENKRSETRKKLLGQEYKDVQQPEKKWKFDFHKFVFDQDYKDAWIDIYGGIVNQEKFQNSETYRNQFYQILPNIAKQDVQSGYWSVINQLKPSKVFFNILDTMQVPHFEAYLQSADMLHQAMLKTSAKYRAIVNLGQRAIDKLGAYSSDDKESVYRRTEQLVDRIIRDRYLLSKSLKIKVPRGQSYFTNSTEVNNSDLDSMLIGLKKITSKNQETTITLGTRAGNASFKMLMETKIIPDLQEGRYGDGNHKNSSISENEFIKSLSPVLYKNNPQYNVSINYAPNINMSPRSDADKALFERIKFAFNEFKYGHLGSIKYILGDKSYDIIELFYYYNQIAFGGRPGENTLTSIFSDVLDYKAIKEFRAFENSFDKSGIIEITDDSLIKEVAPRQSPWNTHLNYFYSEDPNSGKLAFWSRSKRVYDDEGGLLETNINGYAPSVVIYASKEDYKNYVQNETSIDSTQTPTIKLSGGQQVVITFNGGSVSDIQIKNGNSFIKLEIPSKYKEYFDNPPITYILTENGNREIGYNLDALTKYIEQIITCG